MSFANIAGRIVFDTMPEFSDPPSIVGSRQSEMLSISQARRVAQFSGKKPVHMLNQTFRFLTREDIIQFCSTFEFLAGRWKTFWVPSWHAELNPVSGIPNSSPTLSISPVDYATTYLNTSEQTRLGHYIWGLHRDGTVLLSRVNSVSGSDPEILNLIDAPDSDWNLGEFIIGFLYMVRLQNDKLSLDFSGANEATCKLSFIEAINVTDQAGGTLAGEPLPTTPPSGEDDVNPFVDASGQIFTDADGNVFTP